MLKSSDGASFLTLTSCFIRLLSKMDSSYHSSLTLLKPLLEAVLEPLPEPLLEPLFELVIERVTIALVCLFLPQVPSLTELLEVLFADVVEDLTVELLVDLLMRAVSVERPLTSCSKVSSNSSGMFRISCPDRKEYFLAETSHFLNLPKCNQYYCCWKHPLQGTFQEMLMWA